MIYLHKKNIKCYDIFYLGTIQHSMSLLGNSNTKQSRKHKIYNYLLIKNSTLINN